MLLPVLILIFGQVFDGFDTLRLAAGTTIATIAVGAIAGGVSRCRAGQVDLQLFKLLVIPYIVGGFAGPWLGKLLSNQALQIYIAVIVFGAGTKMLTVSRDNVGSLLDFNAHRIEISFVLSVIGAISSMGGIASGLFAIPYLMRFSLPMHSIAGTSTMAAGVYASVASLGYITAGLGESTQPESSFGYVYLPAFAVMAVTSVIVTPIGVKFSQRLNDHVLQKCLAIFLLISAVIIIAR